MQLVPVAPRLLHVAPCEDLPQSACVCLELQRPELDTVLQALPHKHRVECDDHNSYWGERAG